MVMTDGEPVFIDTNILVYASVAESPFHTSALSVVRAYEQTGVELWISRQILREYLAVLSRPQAFAEPIPMSVLIAEVRLFEDRFWIAEDGPKVTETLRSLVERVPCGGKQIHDANIVATMLVHNIRHLLTHNVDDFVRFASFITILPLEAGS